MPPAADQLSINQLVVSVGVPILGFSSFKVLDAESKSIWESSARVSKFPIRKGNILVQPASQSRLMENVDPALGVVSFTSPPIFILCFWKWVPAYSSNFTGY